MKLLLPTILLLAAGCSAAQVDGPERVAQGSSTVAVVEPQSEEAIALRAGRLTDGLNCPICEGYTLRNCPLPVCAQMREQIRQRMTDGESDEAIVASFVEYYGTQALNAPPRRGFWWLAWLMPAAFIGVGAVVTGWWLVTRGRTRGPTMAESRSTVSQQPATVASRPIALSVAGRANDDAATSQPATGDRYVAAFEELAADDARSGGRSTSASHSLGVDEPNDPGSAWRSDGDGG